MKPESILAGILLLALTGAPAAGAGKGAAADKDGGKWDARIHRMKGDVEVRVAGAEEWVRPKRRTPLYEGDALRVGKKGSVDIAYGRRALTHLRPGTHIVIEKLDKKGTRLDLKSGTLLQKLKLLKRHGGKFLKHRGRWSVRTPMANCSVRGTEFGVVVSSETGETTAGVFDEGELALIPLEETAKGKVFKGKPSELTLKPNQEADVAAGSVGEVRPLTDLLAYRGHMRQLRKRLAAIRRRYRSLPIQKRRQLRERLRKGK